MQDVSLNFSLFFIPFLHLSSSRIQNVMPLSSGLLRSQSRNVTPQCPPRVQVQWLRPVSWTRVPDRALKVLVDRPDECHGWRIQCREPLQAMILHIPDENRLRKKDLIF